MHLQMSLEENGNGNIHRPPSRGRRVSNMSSQKVERRPKDRNETHGT
jgi:hypothetical protein